MDTDGCAVLDAWSPVCVFPLESLLKGIEPFPMCDPVQACKLLILLLSCFAADRMKYLNIKGCI